MPMLSFVGHRIHSRGKKNSHDARGFHTERKEYNKEKDAGKANNVVRQAVVQSIRKSPDAFGLAKAFRDTKGLGSVRRKMAIQKQISEAVNMMKGCKVRYCEIYAALCNK
jgi:hypothetical protein